MGWLFGKIFIALLLCFLIGLIIGLLWWWYDQKQSRTDKARLKADLEEKNSQIVLLTKKDEKHERDVNNDEELKKEIKKLKKENHRIAELETTISNLKTKAAKTQNLETQVVDLRNKADKVNKLQAEVGSLKSKTTQLSTLESELKAKTSRVETLEKKLASLKTSTPTKKTATTTTSTEWPTPERTLKAFGEQPKAESKPEPKKVEPIAKPAASPATDTSWSVGKTKLGTLAAKHTDDLKVVNGIGPVMEKTLKGFDIQTWEQLAAFTEEDIAKVTEAIETFPGRIERDNWVSQAADLVSRFPLNTPYDRPTRQTFLNKKKKK